MADQYKKPYLDSSVFIAWIKAEVINGIDRKKIVDHILQLAEGGEFKIYSAAFTLVEVHKKRNHEKLTNEQDEKILAFFKLGLTEKNYDVIGMPQKAVDVKAFKPFEFQYWVINEMYGTPSSKKVGDMGIDGLSFINHYPIQVKQSESVGRNVIDNFQTALRRYYKDTNKKEMIGYIIGFRFSKGAYEEVARAKKDGFRIELIKVQDILDKKFIVEQRLLKSHEKEDVPSQRGLF